MAREKFYVSMDEDDKYVVVWHGKPKKLGDTFESSSTSNPIAGFYSNRCNSGQILWHIIKPCDLKPGQCVEIRPPKLKLAK